MDVFKESKFKLLALADTKLRGNGIIASAQEMERGREGVAILLNDVWLSAVVDFLWIKFKFYWFL